MEAPPKPNPCCNIEENLVPQETGVKDLELKICKICNRRHWEASVDPGIFGIVGAKL